MADNSYRKFKGLNEFLVIKNKGVDTKIKFLAIILGKIWPFNEIPQLKRWPFLILVQNGSHIGFFFGLLDEIVQV